jgi:ribA/ribD-fused uncharacterized protein
MNNIYASEADARQGLSLFQMNAVRGVSPPPYELFWGGFMSQWHEAWFVAAGLTYRTAEHFMMVNKARLFNDHEAVRGIFDTPYPKEAKEIGRTVKNFDERIWAERRYDVVRTGNLLKFNQNAEERLMLMGTGNKLLVEASPYDTIWGIGRGEKDPLAHDVLQWRGRNLLGFALMSVRYSLALLP